MESSFAEVASSSNSNISRENENESFIPDSSKDTISEEPDISDELLASSNEESDSSEAISEVLNGSESSAETPTPPSTSEEEPDVSEPAGPPVHVHEWEEATCTFPKTCVSCGATDGVPEGHEWKDADCDTPKMCKGCSSTSGSAKGHAWKSATCTAPKTCEVCGEADGVATGHSWKEATCTSAKACKTCGVAEGSAKGHDWKDATCTEPKACKACGKTDGSAKGHSYNKGTCTACGAKDAGYVENVIYGDTPVVIEVNGVEYSLTSYAEAEALLPLKTREDFSSPEKGFTIYVKNGAVMVGCTYTANGDGTYDVGDGTTMSDNQLTGVFRNFWCRTCGQRAGDGTHGTCVKYLHDDECDECGEAVKGMNCHTCKEN